MTTEQPNPKKRMSLKKKILFWVAGVFAGLIVLSIVVNIVDPEGVGKIRAEQQAERDAKASEKAAEKAAEESAKAVEASRKAEEEAAAEAAKKSEEAKQAEAEKKAQATQPATETPAAAEPAEESKEPEQEPASQCLEVAESLQQDIASEASGVSMTPVRAAGFKNPDYPSAYLIAMEFASPGGGNEIGVWQSSSLKSGSPIFAVDGMAKAFTNWKHSGDSVVPLDLSSIGVAESKACLG